MVTPRGAARAHARFAVLLLILVAALGSAGAATAAAGRDHTAGTWSGDASLPTEASYLSARAVTVTCAASGEVWSRSLSAVGFPAGHATEYYGYSVIQAGEMALSPYVCRGLQLGATPGSRRGNELQVAWSVDVLLHESAHLGRFTTDEAEAESCARAALPLELHRLYGIALRSAEMSRLTAAAAWARQTQDDTYKGGSCPSAGA
jgi:hypothetical protein